MTYHLIPAADITAVHAKDAGEQYRSNITVMADGGAFVVYEQRLPRPDSLIDVEISAQRFDANGDQAGASVTIARQEGLMFSEVGQGYYPVIAGLHDGGYAIAWHDRTSSEIRVQTYDATDALLNDAILSLPPRHLESRNQDVAVSGVAGSAAITALDTGGFAISWDANYSGILAQYGGSNTNYTQTFDASGIAVSGPVQIMPWVGNASYGNDNLTWVSDTAELDGGNYLVVMRGGEGAPGNDSEHTAVLGRIFDASGAAVTDNFMISQSLDTWADRGSVAVLDNGDFVVAWRGEDSGFWRRFDSDGTPETAAVALDNYYVSLNATAIPDGGFLISAMHSGYSPAYTTYGHRFDADNEQVDERFVLTERMAPDEDTNYYAFPPKFAVLGNDQLLALVEGHASWNGTDWQVMTWRQLAEQLGTLDGDVMTAGADGTALFGRGGDDTLQGAGADDYLHGGDGNDSLTGGEGADTLVAGAGTDVLDGGAGDDSLESGQGDNTVQGGEGTDHLKLDGIRADGVTVRGPVEALMISYEGSETFVEGVETFEFRSGSYADMMSLEEVLVLRNSTIYGTDIGETLIGDYGDDNILGYAGDDSIEGGEGNDTLTGYDGDDTLNGGLGADSLDGRGGNDLLQGGEGDDTLNQGYGNDTVDGGPGQDTAQVGISSWNIQSVSGPDEALTIASYRGNDLFRNVETFEFDDVSMTLSDLVALRARDETGTTGDDTLLGDYSDDILRGAGGNDLFDAGVGYDTLIGGDGSDTMRAGAGDDLLTSWATEADVGDSLMGGDGNDTIDSGAGDDTVNGGFGFDLVEAGDGNDSVVGLNGFDTLMGGAGDDTLVGNFGNDGLEGGDGDDVLNGGLGFDMLDGGADNDLLNGLDGFDTLLGGGGDDTAFGNNGNDSLRGGAGADRLEGGFGADTLVGGTQDDTLFAGNGADLLIGDDGDDRLEGNAWHDTLDGGAGNDVLRGGIGSDTFVFAQGYGADRVADFQNAVDTIMLEAALFSQANPEPIDLLDYAGRTADGFLILDFGNGDTLTFTGVTTTNAILDEVEFF